MVALVLIESLRLFVDIQSVRRKPGDICVHVLDRAATKEIYKAKAVIRTDGAMIFEGDGKNVLLVESLKAFAGTPVVVLVLEDKE